MTRQPIWTPKKGISDNQVLLEPNKYPSLREELKAKRVKLADSVPVKTVDTRSNIMKDFSGQYTNYQELINSNDPTQVPFVTTTVGNVAINPSTVSPASLQKVASNEIVAKSLGLNVVSVLNTLGEICHKDKKAQKMLRDNIYESEGGLRDIVEKVMTKDIFGSCLGYIRDYINKNGDTRFRQMDLLPSSSIMYTLTLRGDIDNIYQYVYNYPYANTQNLFSFPFAASGSIYGNGPLGSSYQADDYLGGYGYGYPGGVADPNAGFGDMDFVMRSNIINTFGLIQLDKRYCVHAVCDYIIKTRNPYGYVPLTRRIYNLVLLYDLYKTMHSTFLSYRACPLLVGYADSTRTVDDPRGMRSTMSALDALYASFQEMGTNGAILLSGLKDQIYHIEAINTQGDTQAFENALTWYAKQIEQCLNQFDLSDSSFASATAQTSVYGRFINDQNSRVGDVIRKTLFRHLIHSNISKDMTDYGYFQNEVPNLDDKLKQVKIFEGSAAVGGFFPNLIKKDNDFMRTKLDEPLLSNEEFEEVKQNIQEAQAQDTMDNTNKSNHADAKPHYKNQEKGKI